MPETPAESARTAAERIVANIRDADLGEGELGASFGIATGTDPDETALLEAADRALLEAKDRLYGRVPS
jgi:PleD family two-component response regulator